jgi:glycosyltransferase involved in cell wall biosynthesis
MIHVTILYTELADYSIACFKALAASGASIQLIHWPVNQEAPFKFDLSFIDDAVVRTALDQQALCSRVEAFRPDLILCSGWTDRAYLKTCKRLYGKSVTILSLDNHWTGSLKQQLARLLAPFIIQPAFKKAFVPGAVQQRYALKLGFRDEDIQTGFYAADVRKFIQPDTAIPKKRLAPQKRFFYLGRYVEHKGIYDLWEAYQIYKNSGGEWELWCAGTGDQFENRAQEDGIKHFGFVQPQNIPSMLENVHAYILPSHFEPWGVSVHEMAAAGLPMILSNQIGAKEMFLKEGINGFSYQSGDVLELAQSMQKMSQLSTSQWEEMAITSAALGKNNTPEIWAAKLLSFID